MNSLNQFSLTQEEVKAEQASFMSKVYAWMGIALLITGITAWYVAQSQQLLEAIVMNRGMFFGLMIGELALVFIISARINKLSAAAVTAMFVAYSLLNGLTLSILFVVYTSASISSTFFITSLTFGAMSAYGYFTKKDLTSLGNIMYMALIGIIIASVVNWFAQNEALYWIISYVGVLVFTGLTAYDTQKIKQLSGIGLEGEAERKGAIMGALTLYLDFINLFIMLLRILGDRR
ncbi:MAG: BAX inhibitor (BI)-1/YccA family protein [Bacteroidetes bacterium]|nr:BAX inhibitor (BI)-1/YccA family protein [Bacteroidota bacterium]